MEIVKKCAKFIVYLALFVAFLAMSYKVGVDQYSALNKGSFSSV